MLKHGIALDAPLLQDRELEYEYSVSGLTATSLPGFQNGSDHHTFDGISRALSTLSPLVYYQGFSIFPISPAPVFRPGKFRMKLGH